MRLVAACIALNALVFSTVGCGSKKEEAPVFHAEQTDSNVISQTTIKNNDLPSPLKLTTGSVGKTQVAITYGSPAVKGREIWGALVPYNEVWRSGANEATTMEFSKNVLIEGQLLKSGKYSFFTIPGEQEWTIIFNSVWEQWGGYDYDPGKDVLRVTVKPQATEELAERLDYVVEKDGVALLWEKMKVKFTVQEE